MKFETADMDREALHELIVRSISPLPIALISTVGKNGIYNAAPFSLVVPVCWKPPIILCSFGQLKGQKKHTLQNMEYARDFVINIMDENFIKPTIQTSDNYPEGVDEMKEVGLTAVASDKVKSPRVAEAQVSLECKLVKEIELSEGHHLRNLAFGEVVQVHLKDSLWVDGKIDPAKIRLVGHLGTETYCRVKDIFELTIDQI